MGLGGAASAQTVFQWAKSDRILVRDAAGRVATISPLTVQPSIASGGGGALVATSRVGIGGAIIDVTAQRALTLPSLAVVARRAARLYGPIGIASLALEGLQWANDRWERSESPQAENFCWGIGAGYVQEYGCVGGTGNLNMCHPTLEMGQSANGYGYVPALAPTREPMTFKLALYGSLGVPWVSIQNCIQMPTDGNGHKPRVYAKLGHSTAGEVTDAELEDAIGDALVASPNKIPDVLQEALRRGTITSDDVGPLTTSGPSSVPGPTTTTEVDTGQGTETVTTTITNNVTYEGDTVIITTTTTTTNGDTTTTTTTTSDTPPEVTFESCGLPNTPACKIDETDTPKAEDTVEAAKTDLETAWAEREAKLEEVTDRDSFGWLWGVPDVSVSCSSVDVAGKFSLDICPALDISRAGFGFLWVALAGLYCWRRVGETVSGGV